MGQKGVVRLTLESIGVRDRVGIRCGKAVVAGASAVKGGRLDRKELAVVLGVYKRLAALDVRRIENIPRSTFVGLGHTLFEGLDAGRLQFISVASPDYRQDLRGQHVDIGDGRSKEEYRGPAQILARLGGLKIPLSYEVLFADLDPEVVGRELRKVDELLEVNFKGLRQILGQIPVRRLSEVTGRGEMERLREEAADGPAREAVEKLQSRATVLGAHKISPEDLSQRALAYAAVGKILEEKFPGAILADIQGRIYPYEQPFYDVLRSYPLPLLRLVSF